MQTLTWIFLFADAHGSKIATRSSHMKLSLIGISEKFQCRRNTECVHALRAVNSFELCIHNCSPVQHQNMNEEHTHTRTIRHRTDYVYNIEDHYRNLRHIPQLAKVKSDSPTFSTFCTVQWFRINEWVLPFVSVGTTFDNSQSARYSLIQLGGKWSKRLVRCT